MKSNHSHKAAQAVQFSAAIGEIAPHIEVRKISLAHKNRGTNVELAQKGWHMTDNVKAALDGKIATKDLTEAVEIGWFEAFVEKRSKQLDVEIRFFAARRNKNV